MNQIQAQIIPRLGLALALVFLLLGEFAHPDTKFSSRLKAFGSAAYLPKDDLQRLLGSNPALDLNMDARFMLKHRSGAWSFNVESALNYAAGDSLAFNAAPQSTLDQSPVDDDNRLVNLTHVISSGNRHRLIHRFDRLSVRYKKANWSLTAGRQALSWGSGIVFQPLDLFSPFAPTTVDRDYKAGDDMLNFEYLFENGSDLQVVSVLRRNSEHDFDAAESSSGIKWHGFVGDSEIELLAGRHYRDDVFGLSWRAPMGGALLRSDLLLTRLDAGGSYLSGIVNLDYSFTWKQRSWYVFTEYFHNGFGSFDHPVNLRNLSGALRARLNRGEVFNLNRDYLALGMQVQWHPLVSQSASVITNLQDGSSLLQLSLNYEPGDKQRVQIGLIDALGAGGDEFGGIEVLPGTTTGGGTRVFLRYLYFF